MKTNPKTNFLDTLVDKVMIIGITLIVLMILNALAILFSNDIAGLVKSII